MMRKLSIVGHILRSFAGKVFRPWVGYFGSFFYYAVLATLSGRDGFRGKMQDLEKGVSDIVKRDGVIRRAGGIST